MTSGGVGRTPQRVRLDADYGYESVLLSNPPVEHMLTDALRRDLMSWQEALEQSNPSDPNALREGWVGQARALRARVRAELGADYEVVWVPDEHRPLSE